MLNIKHTFLKNKGFTLIEVILVLAISSIIIIPIFSILNFSIKACDLGEQKDDLILNGRYSMEYIKGEVKIADKIISSNKILGLNSKYPTNIGFVIMVREKNDIFRYITYYVKDSKLLRIACTNLIDEYPTQINFGGHNTISEFVDNIEESKFDEENSMIFLDFKFKHRKEDLRIKMDIYIRCPMDY